MMYLLAHVEYLVWHVMHLINCQFVINTFSYLDAGLDTYGSKLATDSL